MLLKLDSKQNRESDEVNKGHKEEQDGKGLEGGEEGEGEGEGGMEEFRMDFDTVQDEASERGSSRCYASACLELNNVMIKGALGVGDGAVGSDNPAAHSLSVAVDASLYVCQSQGRVSKTEEGKGMGKGERDGKGDGRGARGNAGKEGFEFLTSDLCASFPIRINASQGGSDPSAVVSAIAMADFASILSVTPTVQAVQLFSEFECHRQEALSIISGFLSSLKDDVPLLPPFQSAINSTQSSSSPDSNTSPSEKNDLKGTQNATSLIEMPSTGNPLNAFRPKTIDSIQGEECLSTYISSYGSPASNQHMITSRIKKSLVSSHKSLEQLHVSSVLPSHSVIAAIEDSILVCERLQEMTVKLRHAVLVTVGMAPAYCGWVYRSPSYTVNPPRVNGRKRTVQGRESSSSCGWGVRSWAVLIRSTLLFMPQPYAASADFSINLDDITVNDPDDSEATGLPEKVVRSFHIIVVIIYLFFIGQRQEIDSIFILPTPLILVNVLNLLNSI